MWRIFVAEMVTKGAKKGPASNFSGWKDVINKSCQGRSKNSKGTIWCTQFMENVQKLYLSSHIKCYKLLIRQSMNKTHNR